MNHPLKLKLHFCANLEYNTTVVNKAVLTVGAPLQGCVERKKTKTILLSATLIFFYKLVR